MGASMGHVDPKFQSALPQRERLHRIRRTQNVNQFQSALPQRERPRQEYDDLKGKYISIRAPTKGATWAIMSRFLMILNFNPRSHKGSDLITSHIQGVYHKFQSALPQRERRCTKKRMILEMYFNPRSHKGSDVIQMGTLFAFHSFQSALPQRERRYHG